MRYLFAFICLVVLTGSAAADALSLQEVRKMFVAAATNKKLASELYQKLSENEGQLSVTQRGYYGLMEARMAEQSMNPWKRYSYFNNGKDRLESAIEASPENHELHFLRFVLQTQCPEFLGYTSNISNDKTMLLQALGKAELDAELESIIVTYLLSSTHCTEVDRARINQRKSQS